MSSPSLAADIAVLGDLTRQLAAADSRFLVFGSSHHQYRFRPPLPEAELAAYEAAHGIRLPADYRCFLAMLGNGGPGPDYGLHVLEKSPRNLSLPFPGVDHYALPEDPMTDDDLLPGILCICHHGCDHYAYLVVNGPAYGSVFEGSAEQEFSLSATSFADWYRRWVERKLRRIGNLPMLERLRLDMPRADVEAMLPGDWSVYTTNTVSPRRLLLHDDVPLDIELDADDIVTALRRHSSM